MKISASKKQLAKIIHENGGWRDGANFSAQDKNASVTFFVDAPWRCGTTRECDNFEAVDGFCVTEMSLKHWHQTILSRDEYFHLYPAPDADWWIEWKGGECPVDEGVVIDVKFRNGTVQTACAARCDKSPNHRYWTWIWSHSGHESDIIAYRLHKPERAKSTAVGDDKTNLATKEEPETMEYKPTIEQLAAEYRNRLDYAERKQQEADSAKAEAEAKLAELVAAGKAVGLALSVAEPETELVITDWRDLRVGDEIEYTEGAHEYMVGRVGTVIGFDRNDEGRPVEISSRDLRPSDRGWPRKWRFIRRPAKGDANA